MPDYEVTLSRISPDGTWVKSVIVEDVQQNIAAPLGIDKLFNWCSEELQTDSHSVSVPQAAIDYWRECRHGGNLQMYEILSQLQNWGISFTVIEQQQAALPIEVTARPQTKQAAQSDARRNSKAEELPDLQTMLARRLEILQAREERLIEERNCVAEEYGRVRKDIQQTTDLLMTLVGSKRPNRKGKETETNAN